VSCEFRAKTNVGGSDRECTRQMGTCIWPEQDIIESLAIGISFQGGLGGEGIAGEPTGGGMGPCGLFLTRGKSMRKPL
jgi:hypothetical protein